MTQSTMTDRMLNTREVAERSGYAENTIRWMRHVGRGPRATVVPGGRKVLYRSSDVEAWLSAGTEPEPGQLASN